MYEADSLRDQTDRTAVSVGPRSRLQGNRAVAFWFVGFSVLLHGLASVLLGPMIYLDSPRYAPLAGSPIPPVDLLGTHGSPAPLVQLVWRLPSPTPLLIQAVASGAAWAFVTCLGIALIRSKRLAAAWVVALTAIFWSPLILFADASIMTESLAISGSLACLTGALCLVNERARSAVPLVLLCVVTVVGFGVAIMSRPSTLIALAPAVILSCAIAWRKGRTHALAISTIAIVGTLLYGLVLGINASQSGPNEYFRASNRLAHRASPDLIEAAKRTGFVDCPALTASELISSAEKSHTWTSIGPFKYRQSSRGPDSAAAEKVRQGQCPGITAWLEASHLTPLEQLIYIPQDTISGYIADGPRLWLQRSLGGESVPFRVQRIAPPVTVAFSMTAIALLAAAFFRAWRRRKLVPLPKSSWYVVGVAFASVFPYSLVVWLADSSDMARHFLPTPIVLGPFALVAVLLAWPDTKDAQTKSPT